MKDTSIHLESLSPKLARKRDAIGLHLAPGYNELIAQLSQDKLLDKNWLVSGIFSRDNNLSLLFERICKIRLVLELKKELKEQNIKFTTQDKPLYKVLKPQCNITYKRQSLWKKPAAFIALVFLLRSFLYLSFRAFGKRKSHIKDQEIFLIETFITKNSFDAKGEFRDLYFPGLEPKNNSKEKTVFLPAFYKIRNIPRFFHLARNSHKPFLLVDDFLKMQDYWQAWIHPFLLKKHQFKNVHFDDICITSLVNEELRISRASLSSSIALLNKVFSRRLALSNNKVKGLISWYENQIISKGLIAGIKEQYPDADIKGYQDLYPPSLLNPGAFLSSLEIEARCAPCEILTIGPIHTQLAQRFQTEVPCKPITSLRRDPSAGPTALKSQKKRLLLPLPLCPKMSKELINFAKELMKITRAHNKEYHLRLCPHPAQNASLFKKDTSLDFSQKGFKKELKKATIVISAGSTTLLEGLAQGIPSIAIGDLQSLTKTPISEDFFPNLYKICYSPQEAYNEICHFEGLVLHDEERRNLEDELFYTSGNKTLHNIITQ
tara:strand:+ start:61271 stop:62914 length:1644 start_codon:yes stop_codon:yes gene_type:complete